MSCLNRVVTLLAIALIVSGCQSSASEAPVFQLLSKGNFENLKKEIRVIDNQSDLNNLYLQFSNVQGPVPSVDFTTNVVLYASIGSQESGGYDLTLESLDSKDVELGSKRALVALLKTIVPRKNCPAGDVISAPFVVATIEKDALDDALLTINEEIVAGPACS